MFCNTTTYSNCLFLSRPESSGMLQNPLDSALNPRHLEVSHSYSLMFAAMRQDHRTPRDLLSIFYFRLEMRVFSLQFHAHLTMRIFDICDDGRAQHENTAKGQVGSHRSACVSRCPSGCAPSIRPISSGLFLRSVGSLWLNRMIHFIVGGTACRGTLSMLLLSDCSGLL